MEYQSQRQSGSQRFTPKFYNSRYVHLKALRKKLEEMVLPLISNNLNTTVVDMGCGEKPYEALFIQNKEIKYVGVDLPGNSNADFELNLATGRCDLDNDSADIVLSIQVLEHVKDIKAYLEECNRILRPGGRLILSTHGYWMFHPDPDDYWRWTRQGLEYELQRAGFKIRKIHGVMGLLSTSLQLFQDAVLISFPLKKYWSGIFCAFLQMLIYVSNEFETYSKSLREYRDRDASVFCLIAELDL